MNIQSRLTTDLICFALCLFEKQDIPAIDIYAFGTLIRRLMDSVPVDGKTLFH